MVDDLIETLSMNSRYSVEKIKQFCENVELENDTSSLSKYKILNSAFFELFKKNINDDISDNLSFLKFLRKYSLNISDINMISISSKNIKNEISKTINEIKKLKSEIPEKLYAIYECDAGRILDRDGVGISLEKYCDSTGMEYKKGREMLSDVKRLMIEKLKRKGIEISDKEL